VKEAKLFFLHFLKKVIIFLLLLLSLPLLFFIIVLNFCYCHCFYLSYYYYNFSLLLLCLLLKLLPRDTHKKKTQKEHAHSLFSMSFCFFFFPHIFLCLVKEEGKVKREEVKEDVDTALIKLYVDNNDTQKVEKLLRERERHYNEKEVIFIFILLLFVLFVSFSTFITSLIYFISSSFFLSLFLSCFVIVVLEIFSLSLSL